ncbi:MAG: class II fructose-bisphosphate aldolase [Ruminococcaceae bacterium]|nr:class II fructose-bisphosphate aldolase [Oscillospiraceae bacterium]
MLVTLKELLKLPMAKETAVGAFNTPNTASLRAVIAAAEEAGEPVVIMHAQLHEDLGICKMDEIAPLMLYFADKASVPVCVHLDHGTDLDYIKRALELGFNSVMYDGSALDAKLNLANTCIARELSLKYGASLEAEVGSMGAREDGTPVKEGEGESVFTEPETAKWFAENSGVDALTCAFGTVHGIYRSEPKLDFDRLGKIRDLVSVPLVMHGGSGVSVEDFHRVISLGIRKVNYYTYMAKAGAAAVAAMKQPAYFHDIETEAVRAMTEDVLGAIRIFSGK